VVEIWVNHVYPYKSEAEKGFPFARINGWQRENVRFSLCLSKN
jgi:hypothetical protein